MIDETKSYENALELDVLSLGPDADVTTADAEVAGASEATMRTFEGTSFGREIAGMFVYASDGDGTTVKVGWTGLREDVDRGEAFFTDVVESIELPSEKPDSDFESCEALVAPTPRPPPPHTEDGPGEVAGTYEMTITPDQIDESEHLTATDPTGWTLTLQGDELRAAGTTDNREITFTLPILEASTTELALEADDCEDRTEPMEITMSFVVNDGSLEVFDVEPV